MHLLPPPAAGWVVVLLPERLIDFPPRVCSEVQQDAMHWRTSSKSYFWSFRMTSCLKKNIYSNPTKMQWNIKVVQRFCRFDSQSATVTAVHSVFEQRISLRVSLKLCFLLFGREVAAALEDPRCSLIQAGTQKPHSGERRKEKTGVIRKGKVRTNGGNWCFPQRQHCRWSRIMGRVT